LNVKIYIKMNTKHITDRFIKYAKVYTESDPNNPDFPSTERQWDLAKILVKELEEIGLEDITLDLHGITQTAANLSDYKINDDALVFSGICPSCKAS